MPVGCAPVVLRSAVSRALQACPQGMAVPVWRRSPRAWPYACGRRSGHLRGCSAFHGTLLSRSGDIADPAVFCSPLRLASPAPTCGAGSERRQSAVPQVRAMPCWQTYGPARWGKRSSYGNGFAIFSRYITEPRDFASETPHPTSNIRLFALIWAIIPPWKGILEPSSFVTVKYRKFSSIPLPCPKRQGDAGGRRRAIAGLHGAVPPGCAATIIGPAPSARETARQALSLAGPSP